jgi:tetratricopeptide (TPR) repeat protein
MRRKHRGRFIAVACAIACVVAWTGRVRPAASGQASPAAEVDALEYPDYDFAVIQLLLAGEATKRTNRLLASEPVGTETARALLARNRRSEALAVLGRIVAERPDRIREAFVDLPFGSFARDAAGRFEAPLRDLVAATRARYPDLSAEDRAWIERELDELERPSDWRRPETRDARLREFIAAYPNTPAALMAEAELLIRAPGGMERLDALEAFARRHSETEAAAHALNRLANDLSFGNLGRGADRDADPTGRFFRLLELVREFGAPDAPGRPLAESGPDRIIGFSISDRTRFDSDANIRRLIDAYREFVTGSFALTGRGVASNGVGYVITSKLFDLYGRLGDPIVGVDGVLTELERDVAEPPAVRYLRAHFYLKLLRERDVASDVEAGFIDKAVSTLRALADERSGPYSRRGLATLASVYFFDRRYHEAAAVHREFLSAYPTAEYAWVANLRLGQALTELDDLEGAAAAYRAAAEAPDAPPVAPVLGGAFQAEVLAALGRADDAADRAAWAADHWDPDYGDRYRVDAQQRRRPSDEPLALSEAMTITRDALATRAAELRSSAEAPGGADLERGRWLLARGQTDAALATLARAAESGRGSIVEPAARLLTHRTRLAAALHRADTLNADRDEVAALEMLDALGQESPDSAVLTARIAHATLLALRGRRSEGADAMRLALDAWLEHHQPPPAPPANGTLAADVRAIRVAVFLPQGGGVYADQRWNAFRFPSDLPSYMVANPEIVVKLPGGASARVVLRQPIEGYAALIYATEQDIEGLTDVIRALGGNSRGQPRQVMATPNQPVGRSEAIKEFWNGFFPMRQGHWSGWELETYPTITDVEFLDDARTRAAARVTVGYSGGTVLLEKTPDGWRATAMTNLWIT